MTHSQAVCIVCKGGGALSQRHRVRDDDGATDVVGCRPTHNHTGSPRPSATAILPPVPLLLLRALLATWLRLGGADGVKALLAVCS